MSSNMKDMKQAGKMELNRRTNKARKRKTLKVNYNLYPQREKG